MRAYTRKTGRNRLPRKVLPCLGCGKNFLTDVAHRVCKRCTRRNNASRVGAIVRHPVAITRASLERAGLYDNLLPWGDRIEGPEPGTPLEAED